MEVINTKETGTCLHTVVTNMTTLRVSIFGVQTPTPGNYFVQLDSSTAWKDSCAQKQRRIVRTETSCFNSMPNFANNCFLLDIQQPIRPGSRATDVLSVNLMRRLPTSATTEMNSFEVAANSKLTLDTAATQALSRGERVSLTLDLTASSEPNSRQYRISLDLMTLARPLWIAPIPSDLKGKPLCNVLVLCAESLPTEDYAKAKTNESSEPFCFVVVSTSNDKARGRSCRAFTASVPNDSSPAWDEWLQIDLSNTRPGRDKLVFNIIDETSHKSLVQHELPLESLTPGPHHNLSLIDGSDGPALFITVQMAPLCTVTNESGRSSSTGSDEDNSDDESVWISASILQHMITAPLPPGCSGYMAHVTASSSKTPRARQQVCCFAEIDTTKPSCSKQIRKNLTAAHGKTGSEWSIDILPLQGQTEASLWPSHHPLVIHTQEEEAIYLLINLYWMNSSSDERKEMPIGTSVMNLGDTRKYEDRAQTVRCDILGQNQECLGEVLVQFSVSIGRFAPPDSFGNCGGFPEHSQEGSKSRVNLLIDDLYSKQASVECLLVSSEHAEASAQLNRTRLRDSEMKRTLLERELQHVQNVLHEERKTARHPLDAKDFSKLKIKDKDSLAYVESVVRSLKMEIQKNKQLEHKVRQMHKLDLEVKDSRLKYSDLKEAHVTQSKRLRCEQNQRIRRGTKHLLGMHFWVSLESMKPQLSAD